MTPDIEDFSGVITEGISEDYAWYEGTNIDRELMAVRSRIQKLVAVMERRHTEHLKIMQKLLDENADLRKKLAEKEQQ